METQGLPLPQIARLRIWNAVTGVGSTRTTSSTQVPVTSKGSEDRAKAKQPGGIGCGSESGAAMKTPGESFSLRGKVAVVTGGSRGIGRAVSVRCHVGRWTTAIASSR